MAKSSLDRWEREFRRAAKADDFSVCRDHLDRLNLPDEPELLVHGTVLVVQACCAYASLDGQSLAGFLELQKYCPDDAPDAKYAFTLDLCGEGYARVLVPAKRGFLDLADLYGHPWWEYKVVGFWRLWVSRTDGEDLSRRELAQIEIEVTEDLRFDYSEDELDLRFDDSAVKGVLQIHVQDVYHSDKEEDSEE
jgi:hypothetical protein